MSHENLRAVQRAIAASIAEPPDAEELKLVLDPNHVLTTNWGVDKRTFHGVDGYLASITEMDAAWRSLHQEVERVIDAGDKGVVVLLRLRASGKQSGAPVDFAWAMLTELAGGKITASRAFLDQDQALKAAGLQD
jgi:ketosteroid isomerase-like protein